jgi:ABC-type antimicrobial peptide transport system permease subunit
MIKNYIKTAWRNLVRNKTFSTINILGLALGITCSMLIMLWVQDERSVDGFHANGKQLYQVYERWYRDGQIETNYFTQGLLARELKRQIPEIQYASGLENNGVCTFEANDKINKMYGAFADTDFFTMFTYPLLQGTAPTALNTPSGITISRRMADMFFGSPERAIGKTIRFENRENLQVTAVFENVPVNSSQQFDFLRNWHDFIKENDWAFHWGNTDPVTFVQLRVNADPIKVEKKIKDFVHQYQPKMKGLVIELGLQRYTDRYLYSNLKDGKIDGGRIEYVRLFTIVAVFILLIACINFMNLATARSTKRAKEVGVRKVIGAVRGALIGQFVGEAMLLTFLSVVLAVILTAMLLPVFNTLTGKQLTLPVGQPVFWCTVLGLLVVTGFVAGSYPALFLSSLNPIKVLKGSVRFGTGATWFRKGLVVFQFSLSIILIVGMIVIYKQTEYTQTKHLGYDRENLVYIPIEGELTKKYELFKEEAGKMQSILSVSKMKESPTGIGHHTGDIHWSGKDPNLIPSFANTVVGYDFIKTLKLSLKEGRDFAKDFGTDTTNFIVNETAAQKIGYADPVGQPLAWGKREGKIIGVVKDFHFNSMHKAIEPLVIALKEDLSWGHILVRVKAGKTKEAIAGLEKICKDLNPAFPFVYQFSDQEYANLYKSEQIVSQLSNIFAFLAIFISCLGLFGLATFSAEQRMKEISVRKVLGASGANIVKLLTTNFLQPVIIAMLIAFPVSWYVMNWWLQDYVYKIDISWWIFGLAGLVAIGIALCTVSFQSIRAAYANPAKVLKNE